MNEINDSGYVQAVLRACKVLEVISKEQSIGLSELGRKSGLKKATVARLMDTLKTTGYVDQDESTKKFFLGIRLVTLACGALERIDIRKSARPLIEKFVDDFGKSILLSVFTHGEIIYIDKIIADPYYFSTAVGAMAQPHCTASGKAIFAYLSTEKRKQLLENDPFNAYTPNTITNLLELEQDFIGVRERGFSVDHQERYMEIVAVGVPIFNYDGNVVGAVTLPRVATSINESDLMTLGQQLVRLGQDISFRMGWQGEKA